MCWSWACPSVRLEGSSALGKCSTGASHCISFSLGMTAFGTNPHLIDVSWSFLVDQILREGILQALLAAYELHERCLLQGFGKNN